MSSQTAAKISIPLHPKNKTQGAENLLLASYFTLYPRERQYRELSSKRPFYASHASKVTNACSESRKRFTAEATSLQNADTLARYTSRK